MRLKSSDRHFDSVLIMRVLARPGTPSRMQWPRLKRAINSSSITSSWPTMTRLNWRLISLKTSLSCLTASRSLAAKSAAAVPAAVGVLVLQEPVEQVLAVGAPGDALIGRRGPEEPFPAVVAQDVHRLAVIEMGVFIVLGEAVDRNRMLAVAEPLLDQLVL